MTIHVLTLRSVFMSGLSICTKVPFYVGLVSVFFNKCAGNPLYTTVIFYLLVWPSFSAINLNNIIQAIPGHLKPFFPWIEGTLDLAVSK